MKRVCVSISIRDLHQKLFNSSSGSYHGSDVTWQEIGRTCGSVYSCPSPGSQNAVPPMNRDEGHYTLSRSIQEKISKGENE